MRQIVFVLVLLALCLAGTAHAQVAAPDYHPAAFNAIQPGATGYNGNTMTPDNPAALAWAPQSAVAIGMIDESDTLVSASGWFAGWRAIGDRWSFAIDTNRTENNGVTTEKVSSVQIGFKLFDGLALGVGQDEISDPANADISATTVGLSVLFGKTVYLGLAVGSEDGTGTLTGNRGTTLYGIAWRPEGGWNWSLSYDHRDKEAFLIGGDFTDDTFLIQIHPGSWLFGIGTVDQSFSSGAVSASSTIVDVGWLPEKGGLSVTARVNDFDPSGGTKVRNLSVALGYQY